MNQTETAALAWLTERGHIVRFQSRRSPDFVSEDGDGFEVKLIREGTVTFWPAQIATLNEVPETLVFMFDRGEAAPRYVASYGELTIPGRWSGLRLNVVHDENDWTVRSITPETIRAYRVAAAQRGMTLGQYLTWLSLRLPD